VTGSGGFRGFLTMLTTATDHVASPLPWWFPARSAHYRARRVAAAGERRAATRGNASFVRLSMPSYADSAANRPGWTICWCQLVGVG
jgi:hypothetical protein